LFFLAFEEIKPFLHEKSKRKVRTLLLSFIIINALNLTKRSSSTLFAKKKDDDDKNDFSSYRRKRRNVDFVGV